MRTKIYIFAIILLAVGCKRRVVMPPAENFKDVPVKIDLVWQTPKAISLPSGFYSCFYPKVSIPFVDYLSTYGGVINLNVGDYSILTFNNDTQAIRFRNTNNYNDFEAYTTPVLRPSATQKGEFEEGIAEPDLLYVASVDNLVVSLSSDTLVLTKNPKEVVNSYPFTFKGVEGVENLNLIRASINGVAKSFNMATQTVIDKNGTIFCSISKTSDGFKGSFRTFGKIEYQAGLRNIFSVEIFYNSKLTTYNYDVTDMLVNDKKIEITEKLSFKPVDNGGFDTEIKDWDKEDIEFPI